MKLRFPFNKATIDVIVEDSDSDRRGVRKNRRKKRTNLTSEADAAKMVSEKAGIPGTETVSIEELQTEKGDDHNGESASVDGAHVDDSTSNETVLMVETENVVHNSFRQTEEIKVCQFK